MNEEIRNGNTDINIREKANLIWSIADLIGQGVYKPHEYGKVILPMTVIKRFDDLLKPRKEKVLVAYEKYKHFEVRDGFLKTASGYGFYNISPYTFDSLLADSEHIETNCRTYLAGFSDNVQDILENFDFDTEISKLANNGMLFLLIQEFNKKEANMGHITSTDMGYIFEELVRRFSESYNEHAGAHFTARDIIYLMTDLLIAEDKERLIKEGVTTTIYDQAMGTSQMLACMEERLRDLDSSADVRLFGQEVNPETYAIAKADMLIKGGNANNMRLGNTLSNDQFKGYTFDYCLSNPPFGIDWRVEKQAVEAEAAQGDEGRFGVGLPYINDGQQLFDLNGLSKLKEDGGRMAIVHNGSPLFTAAAGSGPSEIRRYIIENDWLEAIVQLPNDLFYNTGITTYIWIMSKSKPLHRRGKVQLIDASQMFAKRRKSIGNKRVDISKDCREVIIRAYGEFKSKEYVHGDRICESKIFNNEDFGYNEITVETPLRLNFKIADERINRIRGERTFINLARSGKKGEAGEKEIEEGKQKQAEIIQRLKSMKSDTIYKNREEFSKVIWDVLEGLGAPLRRVILTALSERDETADICKDSKGLPEPDTDLRDTERVPLVVDIDDYFEREVRPYNPDAWMDKEKTKVGYEIPFTRHFYKFQEPEESEAIAERIVKIEEELIESLNALFAETKAGETNA